MIKHTLNTLGYFAMILGCCLAAAEFMEPGTISSLHKKAQPHVDKLVADLTPADRYAEFWGGRTEQEVLDQYDAELTEYLTAVDDRYHTQCVQLQVKRDMFRNTLPQDAQSAQLALATAALGIGELSDRMRGLYNVEMRICKYCELDLKHRREVRKGLALHVRHSRDCKASFKRMLSQWDELYDSASERWLTHQSRMTKYKAFANL